MTRFTKVLGATALALMLGAAGAIAQTPAPSTAPAAGAKTPPAAATTKTAPAAATGAADATAKKGPARKVATTEAGKQCSAEADAKNLHGKERKTFRRGCMKTATKKS
jgi:hypothetical protein